MSENYDGGVDSAASTSASHVPGQLELEMVNLSSELIHMDILSPPIPTKLAVKSRKRKLKVRFDVPDKIEMGFSQKRCKSPSPPRESKPGIKKRKILRVKRPAPMKSCKATVPKSITKPPSKPYVGPKITCDDRETTATFPPPIWDKNNNCSILNTNENAKHGLPMKKLGLLQQKTVMNHQTLTQKSLEIKAPSKKSDLRKYTKSSKRKSRQRRTKCLKAGEFQNPSGSSVTCKSEKICQTKPHRYHRTVHIKHKKQVNQRGCSILKSKSARAAMIKRKLTQRRKKAQLELKKRMREKLQKQKARQMMLQIEAESDKYQRRFKRKIRIIPIKRDSNYDVIPALRVSFLKYKTFKEAFEHRYDCCSKCCWDRWSEVNADDIDEDYN